MKVVIVFALLVAVAVASDYGRRPVYGKDSAEDRRVSYEFQWSVDDDESSVEMSHKEARKDDDTTGEYRVVLPDGRRQIVTYTVDGDAGYVAQVRDESVEDSKEDDRQKPTAKPVYRS